MSVEACLDTNVLLYALSKAPEDAAKRKVARDLMRAVRFGVSLQVLQEFYNAARRKARLRISEKAAESVIVRLLESPTVVTDAEIFAHARALASRYGVGYWDASVLAATEAMGASVLYTEDLNDGQLYDGVRVVNPFAAV